MESAYLFPKDELLRYQHVFPFVSGEKYLLVMAYLIPSGGRPFDYALRAKEARDGLEAFRFTEEELRKKKNDKDLYWTVTDLGDGAVTLFSETANRYLALDGQGARLSKEKTPLKLTFNGTLLRFSSLDGEWNLRCAGRSEVPVRLIFTSGKDAMSSSFGLFRRKHGIPVRPEGQPRLTVGTITDIHVDYGIQLFRPYLRKSMIRSALGFRRRYDVDAMLICGDIISDNGSGSSYPRGGAMQGKWPRERFLRVQKLLDGALRRSFRREEVSKNLFYLSGNHDHQVGDRQPAGKTYNSAYYTQYLPKDIRNVLTETADVAEGPKENLLCYQYEVNGYDFLILCTPFYPLIEGHPVPERPCPAHDLRQVRWLEQRLNEIEAKKGKNAVIFVASHYPFRPGCFAGGDAQGINNIDACLQMEDLLNRYPNLFYFYGHFQGGDLRVCLRHTAENMCVHSPVALRAVEENGIKKAVTDDSYDRARFCSDVIDGLGFHEEFAGGMVYYKTHYFKNDGVKVDTWLTHLELPFFQGCAVEVYDDRVVLTMENFGTKAGVYDYLPDATYKLTPVICPLVKD